MITDTTLAEIEAAARAATEGPWQTMAGDPLAVDAHSGVYVAKMTGATPVTELAANARFIVLACNNAAAMAQEIRALREALDPDETKYAYMGEFKNENGSYVSWTTVKEIMAAIKARATQKGTSDV